MTWVLAALTALLVGWHERRRPSVASDPNCLGIFTALAAIGSVIGEAAGAIGSGLLSAGSAVGGALGSAAGSIGSAFGGTAGAAASGGAAGGLGSLASGGIGFGSAAGGPLSAVGGGASMLGGGTGIGLVGGGSAIPMSLAGTSLAAPGAAGGAGGLGGLAGWWQNLSPMEKMQLGSQVLNQGKQAFAPRKGMGAAMPLQKPPPRQAQPLLPAQPTQLPAVAMLARMRQMGGAGLY